MMHSKHINYINLKSTSIQSVGYMRAAYGNIQIKSILISHMKYKTLPLSPIPLHIDSM